MIAKACRNYVSASVPSLLQVVQLGLRWGSEITVDLRRCDLFSEPYARVTWYSHPGWPQAATPPLSSQEA